MNVHMNALQANDQAQGDLDINTLKKYIGYVRK